MQILPYHLRLLLSCLLAVGLLCACDRYNPVNEEINQAPPYQNLLNQTSLTALQDALKAYPEIPENYYKIARILYQKQSDSLASQHIQEAIKLDSNQQKYRLLYAQILYQQDRKMEADEQIQRVLSTNEIDFVKLFLAAKVKFDLKDYDNALKLLNNALQIDDKNPEIYYWKGKIGVARRDSTQALANLRKALSLRPKFAEVFASLTELYSKYELYSTANRFANRGIQLDPNYAPLYFHKAEAFRLRVYFDDSAKVAYQKAFELDKGLYLAAYHLGKYAFNEGKCSQAKQYLEHALRYENDLDKANYYLGVCYRRAGDKETALRLLALSIKQNPNYLPANDLYWGIKNEIAQAKMIAREDSLRRAYYKQLEEQRKKEIQ